MRNLAALIEQRLRFQFGNKYSNDREPVINAIQEELKNVKEVLQDFVDISAFDLSDPRREELPALKTKAKILLGNQWKRNGKYNFANNLGGAWDII